MPERPLTLEGWGLVSLLYWTAYERQDGLVDSSQAVAGYLRVYGKEDLPEMDLTRDSRWTIALFGNADLARPFYIVPGCKVAGIQLFDAPVLAGFRPYASRGTELTDAELLTLVEQRGYKAVKIPEFTP